MHWLPLAIYVLVGPLAWAGLFALGLFARKRMSRLRESADAALPHPPPTLSIIIPAKDEAAGIEACVNRVMAQDYPGFEVVVINDRSADGTGEILDRLRIADCGLRNEEADLERSAATPNEAECTRDPSSSIRNPQSAIRNSLKVVHITALPPGWLGKCHALHVGTRDLTSDWLFFVDSDVSLSPGAARQCIAVCERRGWDALSVMPTLKAQTFWERTLLPLLAYAWACAFRMSMTNDDSRPDVAVANGQFFLIRRAWYERVDNHACVRDRIVEDVMLMRTLKRAGAKVRLQLGQELADTRMHATLSQIFHGWARIFAGTSGRSPWPMVAILAFVVVGVLSLPAGLAIGLSTGGAWLVASIAHAVILLSFLALAYGASGQSPANALLLPVTLPMLMAVLAYAIRACRSGAVNWRGASVTIDRGR